MFCSGAVAWLCTWYAALTGITETVEFVNCYPVLSSVWQPVFHIADYHGRAMVRACFMAEYFLNFVKTHDICAAYTTFPDT
jgi:hypothetical protein